jgi:hypothetical protein
MRCSDRIAHLTSNLGKEDRMPRRKRTIGTHAECQRWRNIKQRCFNKSRTGYENWGGRGITMHGPWINNFELFYSDLMAEIGPRPSLRHTLDRKDNDGNYEPGNLRWATYEEQAANRRKRGGTRTRDK